MEDVEIERGNGERFLGINYFFDKISIIEMLSSLRVFVCVCVCV